MGSSIFFDQNPVIADLEVDGGTLSVDETNNRVGVGTTTPATTLDVNGTTTLDNTDIDGTLTVDGSNISLDSTSTLNIDNSNTSNGITIGTATSGVPVSIGHTTSETTVNDNLTVTGDLTVNGTTTTINSTTLTVDDKTIVIASGASDSAAADGAGISVDGASATFLYDHTGTQWEMNKPLEVTGNITTTGDIILDDGGSLKEAGGTAAITFDGSGHVTKIGQDSPSSGEFLKYDGAKWVSDAVATGSSAADDISTGDAAVTIATTSGNITIDAQGNDTDIIFKGTDGNADTTFLTIDGSEAGKATFNGEIVAPSLDISGDADIDGTLEADAITVGGTALNTVIAGVTVTNATNAVDATNAAHVTVSDNENTNEENLIPFIEDASATGNVGLESDGDFSYNPSTGTVTATIFKGNIDAVDGDFDGTLEADAITVGGTALNEFIQDTVGAMVSSNTETGITVTYEDGDGTLDFVLAAPTSLGTITQDTVTFTSTNANDPQVFIKNTTNDANGPVLVLENDRGSNNGADNDVCGIIEFKGTDDASAQTTFALVSATVKDASNGAEGGEFGVEVATHDGEMQFGLRITDGDAEDELDVEIGSGINSVTTAAGYVKGANGVLVPEGKSVHIETPMLASADLTATGITTLMTASEAIAQGDLVYVSGDGTIGKALSNDIAKLPAIGLAVAAINQNQPGAILLQGMFRNDAYGFTAGNRLYVHTDGTITATAPSGNNQGAQAIGVALEPDVVYFNPSMVVVEITA